MQMLTLTQTHKHNTHICALHSPSAVLLLCIKTTSPRSPKGVWGFVRASGRACKWTQSTCVPACVCMCVLATITDGCPLPTGCIQPVAQLMWRNMQLQLGQATLKKAARVSYTIYKNATLSFRPPPKRTTSSLALAISNVQPSGKHDFFFTFEFSEHLIC